MQVLQASGLTERQTYMVRRKYEAIHTVAARHWNRAIVAELLYPCGDRRC